MTTDRESAELIKKLLVNDDPYVFDEADREAEDDPDDSDYEGTPVRKKPRNAKSGKTPLDKIPEEKRRRKDANHAHGRGRFWTEHEEMLFQEALSLYGRDWKECAKHVGTRDARSIATHAQKHFIKLCLNGKSLPEKVVETGIGYTLSGKLLDPSAKSSITFGFKKERFQNLSPEKLEIVKGGIQMDRLEVIPEKESKKDQANPVEEDSQKDDPPKQNEKGCSKKRRAGTLNKEGPTKKVAPKDDSGEYLHKLRTDYALNRPQRAAARNRRVQMGSTSDSIQLVECEEFASQDQKGILQPFTIDVAAEAMLLMDFHAHLSEFEIIGLLAGSWDGEKRHLTIIEAIPCERAEGSCGRTSVELDPASEVNARSEMVKKGLISTGWYHSHPVFSATPSLKDIENQRNYQTLFRCEDTKVEPFVGLIISPYDAVLSSPKSNTCGFFVLEKNQGIKPFRLEFNVIDRLEKAPLDMISKCEAVLRMLKAEKGRVNLKSVWRNWSYLEGDEEKGKTLTKIEKLKLSLQTTFKDESLDEAKTFINDLVATIETTWGISFTTSF